MFLIMDDEDQGKRDATEAVVGYFHAKRKMAKEARKGAAKSVQMHHRANTDWWNDVWRK
jgi:hypothetical protein